MTVYTNASPEFIPMGAKDLSNRVIPNATVALPQHVPLFYVFASRGPTEKQLVDSSRFAAIYGKDTLNEESPYYNHVSPFLSAALSNNASCVVKRVIPDDAGVRANCTIYIDVLKTKIINYLRNSDGSLVPNERTNDYQIDLDNPVIDGYRIKYIKEFQSAGYEGPLGNLKSKAGTMVDADTGLRSVMYPIIELRAKYQGADYNNIGFSIGTLYNAEQDEVLKSHAKALVYSLSIYKREGKGSTPKFVSTLYDESSVNFVFRPDQKDVTGLTRVDFERVMKTRWTNEEDPLLPIVFPELDDVHFYQDYYENVCAMFTASEQPYVSIEEKVWNDGQKAATLSWYDFTSDEKEEILSEVYLINPFSCTSSRNVKYITIQYDDGIVVNSQFQQEVNMSSNVPIFLEGGNDGTLSNDQFEARVIEDVSKYGNPNSDYQDLATNLENFIWDSGYSLKAKFALMDFILLRKDTVLMLTTHESRLKNKCRELTDERAIGSALRTKLRLCPESTYYGTDVGRAVIQPGTGLIREVDSDIRIPLTYSLMIKCCKMFGAADGKWKSAYKFDRANAGNSANPGNIIEEMYDIQPEFISAGIKPVLWRNGLVWAQPFERKTYHFPAIQTIYDDDTSTLNALYTVMALSTVTRINAEAFRHFVGDMSTTDAVFIAEVTEWLKERFRGVFDDLITPIPNIYLTDKNKLEGYSWTAETTIYSSGLRTKCVYTTVLKRASDLEAQATV